VPSAGSDSRRRDALFAGAVAVLGVFGVVFAEGAIIALVALAGPLTAFGVLTFGCSAISMLIAFAFDAEDAGRGPTPLVRRTRAWIARRRAEAERRAARLAHLSEVVAFVVLSVTVGPFITTIAIKLRDGTPQRDYLLCIASSVLFSAAWVLVYSGGLAVVRQAFTQ
jgi:hypothetical protein